MKRTQDPIEKRVLEQALDMFIALMYDLLGDGEYDQKMTHEDYHTARRLFKEVTGAEHLHRTTTKVDDLRHHSRDT